MTDETTGSTEVLAATSDSEAPCCAEASLMAIKAGQRARREEKRFLYSFALLLARGLFEYAYKLHCTEYGEPLSLVKVHAEELGTVVIPGEPTFV